MSRYPRRQAHTVLRFLTIAILVIAMNMIAATFAHAAPSPFGSNHYEFVQVADPYTGNNNSWSTASAAAVASTYLGVSGHLVTITSQAENSFVFGLAPGGA